MNVPLKRHLYVSGLVPVAVTVNVAVVPATFVMLAGWVVMTGAAWTNGMASNTTKKWSDTANDVLNDEGFISSCFDF